MRLFVLAKDRTGLRGVAVHLDIDDAETEAVRFKETGFEIAVVSAFDLSDVMASHPAWFRIEAA